MRLSQALLILLLLAPASLASQVVRGVVVDGQSSPVAGMVVSLHGSGGGAPIAGGLTDAEGRFSVRAPAPGRYTVRVERIGYRRVEAPVDVAEGTMEEVWLTTAMEAFVLAPLQVETEARCVVRPGVGLQAYDLWQQAAVALRATALAQEQALVEYTVRTYTRELVGTRQRRSSDPARRVTGNPFQTLPPAVLARDGYMSEDGRGYTLYGPDAQVLLSDEFLDTHCLFVQTEGGQRGQVGVGFEPVEGRTQVDIRGTLWLDRRTGELRSVEYRYTGMRGGPRAAQSGGEIEFQRQRSGAWVVSRWNIRSARVEQDALRAGANSVSVVADIREAGGEVTDVRLLGEDAEPLRRHPPGSGWGAAGDPGCPLPHYRRCGSASGSDAPPHSCPRRP